MAVFMLLQDNGTYLAVPPDKLLLAQEGPGKTKLGFTIQAPVLGADQKPVLNDDKTPKVESRFQSIMEFPVNIALPEIPKPTKLNKKAKKR